MILSNKHSCYCLNTSVGKQHTLDLHTLNTLTTQLSNGVVPDTITSRIKNSTSYTKFNTLLDTGALQGSYIKGSKFRELKECTEGDLVLGSCNVNVCGAFNDCQHSDSYIMCNVEFNFSKYQIIKFNKVNVNKRKFCNHLIKLIVLEQLPFDMIIGRGDINKYDLWNTTTRVQSVNLEGGSLPPKPLNFVASNLLDNGINTFVNVIADSNDCNSIALKDIDAVEIGGLLDLSLSNKTQRAPSVVTSNSNDTKIRVTTDDKPKSEFKRRKVRIRDGSCKTCLNTCKINSKTSPEFCL